VADCVKIVTQSEAKSLKHSKIQILRYVQDDKKAEDVPFYTAWWLCWSLIY